MAKKEIRKERLYRTFQKIQQKKSPRQPEIVSSSSPIRQPKIVSSSSPIKITILISNCNSDQYIGLPLNPLNPNNDNIKLENETWQNNYDKFNLYDYKTLNEIPESEKYFIHLSMYWDLLEYYLHEKNGSFKTKNNPYPMPDRVWNDSANGLVHWIINYNTECNQLDGIDCFDITDITVALNTTPKNVTLITGAATVNTGKSLIENFKYNVVTGLELWRFCRFDRKIDKQKQKQKIESICNKVIMPYKSLNYNRLPRQHRTVVVAHQMHHNYTEALYSLSAIKNKPNNARWWEWRPHFPEYEKEFLKLEEPVDIYCKLPEEEYNETQAPIDLQLNLADKTGWNHALNSSFQLVTETHPFYMKYPFITEKSIKPLGMLMPFIQSAPQHNIKHLREYGIRMFDKWIDHSYDNEPDDILRLRMVLKEFDRLYAIPKDQWADMLVEMLPDLLHNAFLLTQEPMHSVESQLIPIFQKFLKE